MKLKTLLRSFTTHVPVRGRHRLADKLGAKLSHEREVITLNGFKIQIDHTIATCRYIYYGVYEEGLINFLKRTIKEGDVVFDPGANIGYITSICLGLVGKTGHVYAFEPSPTCYAQLDLNKLPNLTLHNAAISYCTAIMVFYDTPAVISSGFACLSSVEKPLNGHAVNVQAYSIDEYCRRNMIERIKFLKLDVEGAELDALKGSTEMLSRKAIDYILVETEINNDAPALIHINNEIFGMLRGYGYTPHLMKSNGILLPVDLSAKNRFRRDILWTLD